MVAQLFIEFLYLGFVNSEISGKNQDKIPPGQGFGKKQLSSAPANQFKSCIYAILLFFFFSVV